MDQQTVKKRTLTSTISLFLQSGYSALLGLAANLALTILLKPAIFGIYITVLALISVLNYFSDIGLAASLIQKKDITNDDIKTTFTVQQILILTLITIGFSITGVVMSFYQLPVEAKYLYWALLGGFFLSSLKTIPSVLLERKIKFDKIVIVQVVENTVFYLTVIILAVMNFGLLSFAYAVIFRSIIGVIIIYSLSFWIPRVGISVTSLKKLLSFGLPFQASSFLAIFKDDLLILYLGKAIGFTSLGYIGWAKKWAEFPIRIVMDNISRVLFPVFSRIQSDKERLGRLVEKILYYQTVIIAPAIFGMIIIMSNVVSIIPKYSKWAPALPLFYIFCISALLSTYSSPFINLFNALGKVKYSFSLMLFWTGLTWGLTVILTSLLGKWGFPLAHFTTASTFIIVIILAKRFISFSYLKSVIKPLFSALIMFLALYIVKYLLGSGITVTLVLVITGGVIYLSTLRLLKINLITDIKRLFKNE